MGGRGTRRGGAPLWQAASIAVLVGLAVLVLIELDSTPRESLCAQGATLAEAGLLQQSQQMLSRGEAEGESCTAGELSGIEDELDEAEKAFSAARAFGAIAPTGKPKAKKALVAQRNANRAIRRYVAGLRVSPFDEAARLGLAGQLAILTTATHPRAAQSRCRLGSRLTEAALLDDATTALSKGLQKALADCRKALVVVNDRRLEAAARVRHARRQELEGAGAETIRRSYAAALSSNAQLAEARSGLEDRLEQGSQLDAVGDWLSGIPGTLKAALEWLVPLLALLLVLILLIGALLRLLTRSARVAWHLAKWSENPTLGFLRGSAVPKVSVGDFEGGGDSTLEGTDFSSLLADSLPQKAGREPAFPFDRLTRGSKIDQQAAEVPDVLAEVPQAKALGSLVTLIGKLFQRRRIVVGGRLIPIGNPRGAGVTIALEGKDNEATVTLWEGTYDKNPGGEEDATRWLRLLPAATVWARWQIAARIVPDLDPERWRADALFQSAVAWQAADDPKRAEALYLEALELDATLLPAQHNLAAIAVRDKRYAEARERLRALLEQLDGDAELKKSWPPLEEASVLYTLTLAHAYETAEPEDSRKEGLRTATELVETIATHLQQGPAEDADAAEFVELERAEAPSVVVLASLAITANDELRKKAVRKIVEKKGVDPIGRDDLRHRLHELNPWDLIDGYVRELPNLSRRTHYNLACYYTALSVGAGSARSICLDLAVTELKLGLQGRASATLSRDDPSLAPLRREKSRWASLQAYLRKHSIEPHPEPDKDGG